MRAAEAARKTAETDVTVFVDLDGAGRCEAATGVGFVDHMLAAFARHALCDVRVRAAGDLQVDAHHTVEDTGIALGQALRGALGDRAGLRRYGSALLPMDEALCRVALDLSGRPFLAWDVPLAPGAVIAGGGPAAVPFSADLGLEFWRALAVNAGWTLHVTLLAGANPHHILEAVWKGCGLALRQAAERDPRIDGPLSTKGVLA